MTDHAERVARVLASSRYTGRVELDVQLLAAAREYVDGVVALAAKLGETTDDLAGIETVEDFDEYHRRIESWLDFEAERSRRQVL